MEAPKTPEEFEKLSLESALKYSNGESRNTPVAIKTGLIVALSLALVVIYLVYTSGLQSSIYIAIFAFGSGALVNSVVSYKTSIKIESFYLKYIDKVKVQNRLNEIDRKNS